MDVFRRTVRVFKIPGKESHFIAWLDNLKDLKARYLIKARLDRLEVGNFGDHRSLGAGVYELRIHFGPGYRLYIGISDKILILLLAGGDKKSQRNDVKLAQKYWRLYKEGKNG